MEIERHAVSIDSDRESIEKFADRHGLVMKVTQFHDSGRTLDRFQAHFKSVEIRRGFAGLLSTYGVGVTEDQAIADYANKISNQLLIVNATGPDRREIRVPQLTHTPTP